MTAGRHNNRGRIGKASTSGAVNGIPIRGASSRAGSSARGRLPLGSRSRVRELLPNPVKDRTPQARKPRLERSQTVKYSQEIRPFPAQNVKPEVTIEAQPRKVERVHNGIWESGLATFAFATHANLDHSEDTIVVALNILDHIIRPENWNPELSNNKLSASCFFFAAKLTGKTVTAAQVAGSIWIHPSMVAEMCQVNEGPLYDRTLQSLTVSIKQVVQGYEILHQQRESLKDLLGEYGQQLENLPSPATEMQLLESDNQEGPCSLQVAEEMINLGYQRGSETGEKAEVEDVDVVAVDEEGKAHFAVSVDGEVEEEGEYNNDFDDFVAENE